MIGGLNQRPDVGSGPVAPPLGPQTRTAAATHRPAGRPVPPDAISGMTYRYEQAVRSAAQITPAEYALPAAMPSVCVAGRRSSDSGQCGSLAPSSGAGADCCRCDLSGPRWQRPLPVSAQIALSVMGWNGRLAGALACLRRGGDRRLAAGVGASSLRISSLAVERAGPRQRPPRYGAGWQEVTAAGARRVALSGSATSLLPVAAGREDAWIRLLPAGVLRAPSSRCWRR